MTVTKLIAILDATHTASMQWDKHEGWQVEVREKYNGKVRTIDTYSCSSERGARRKLNNVIKAYQNS